MKNIKTIRLYESIDFRYGNCAIIAIAGAFDMNYRAAKTIAILLRMDPFDGLNFNECTKMINTSAKCYDWKVKYKSNKYAKLKVVQICDILDTGRYILCFSQHLSYLKDGNIYDSYYDKDDLVKAVPTGWWEIKE